MAWLRVMQSLQHPSYASIAQSSWKMSEEALQELGRLPAQLVQNVHGIDADAEHEEEQMVTDMLLVLQQMVTDMILVLQRMVTDMMLVLLMFDLMQKPRWAAMDHWLWMV